MSIAKGYYKLIDTLGYIKAHTRNRAIIAAYGTTLYVHANGKAVNERVDMLGAYLINTHETKYFEYLGTEKPLPKEVYPTNNKKAREDLVPVYQQKGVAMDNSVQLYTVDGYPVTVITSSSNVRLNTVKYPVIVEVHTDTDVKLRSYPRQSSSIATCQTLFTAKPEEWRNLYFDGKRTYLGQTRYTNEKRATTFAGRGKNSKNFIRAVKMDT